jgi:hypothetical protein
VDGGVRDGALLLQWATRRHEEVVWTLVSDEKYNGVELTVDGRQCLRDAMWRVK